MTIIQTPQSAVGRLIDFLLTALAWIVFLYLFGSGIWSILTEPVSGISVPLFSRLLPHAETLLVYALVVACICLLLAVWASYNAQRFGKLDRRRPTPELSDETLAGSFQISSAHSQRLHTSHIIHIHHTEDGQISLIDFQGAPGASASKVVAMPHPQK